MRRLYSCFTTTLGILFLGLFAILMPFSIVFFNIQLNLLSPHLYKNALADQEFYQQLPTLVAGQIITGFEYNPCEADPTACEGEGPTIGPEAGPPSYFTALSEEDWETILAKLLPEDWFQEQVEGMIDEIFAFLDGEKEALNIVFATVDIRDRLSGPIGEQVIREIMSALPECKPEEAQQALARMSNPDNPDLPDCRPPAELLDPAMNDLQNTLIQVSQQIPKEVNYEFRFDENNTPQENPGPLGNDPVKIYQKAKSFFLYSPVIAFGILVIAAALLTHSYRGFVQFLGTSLLIICVVLLIPSLFAEEFLQGLLERLVISNLPDYLSSRIDKLLLGFLDYLSSTLIRTIRIEAGVIGAGGLLLIILAGFFPHRQEEQEPTPTFQNP